MQPADAVWVVNAYQLAVVVALLPLAALGERLGYRRVYIVGLVVFVIGSLACALSSSLDTLVASRTLQGMGAAGIMAVNGALLRYTWPHAMLGRGVGWNALVVSAAAAAGPTIAAGILAVATWPWLFAINVPLGLITLVVASRALPASDRSTESFDKVSAALNVLVFGALFVGIDIVVRGDGHTLSGVLTITAAVLAGIVLVRRERHATKPIIPVDLLAIPVFSLSVVASICSFTTYTITFLVLPFHLQGQLGYDQVHTGLLMTPWPLALGVIAPLAGRLADTLPAGLLGTVGMAILAAGLATLAWIPADADAVNILWRMALCGAGFALFQSPNNRTLLAAAPRARAGAAGGMLATARLTGMTLGASIAALVFHFSAQSTLHVAMIIGMVFAVLAGIASYSRVYAKVL